MSEYKPVTVADHLGRFGAGLVGEGCPYRSVQQFAYELLNLAQPGQLPAGFVERAIQAAQLLDPALLSSGSNP